MPAKEYALSAPWRPARTCTWSVAVPDEIGACLVVTYLPEATRGIAPVYDGTASAGLFTATDPIGFGGGDTNLYGYVLGGPVNGFDPDGAFALPAAAMAAVAVVGLAAAAAASDSTVQGNLAGGIGVDRRCDRPGCGSSVVSMIPALSTSTRMRSARRIPAEQRATAFAHRGTPWIISSLAQGCALW